MPAKILLIDIETAPMVVYAWDIWQQNIGLNQIIKDWHLLAFSAKWLGNKTIIYQDQSKVKPIENDKSLCLAIKNLLDEADIVIGQNGDAFDIPKIKSRMLFHKIHPPSTFKTIDTLKTAKRMFAFTSNKLEYMSEKFTDTPKDQHKKFPGFTLWSECLKGNKVAWVEMRKYNIKDVLALEKVYLETKPWMDKHPNLGVYSTHANAVCPKCDSSDLQRRGFRYTQVSKFARFQCNNCHSWSSERTPENSKENRKNQLLN